MVSIIAIATGYSLIYLTFNTQKKIRTLTSLVNAMLLSGLALTSHTYISPQHLNDYITGYFIYDLLIGHFADKANFGFLTGYVHHTVYIGLLGYLRKTNESHLIYLFLPFEIATVFQDIKKLYPNNTTDTIFICTFVTSRVLYNIYVISELHNRAYKIVTTLMLLVHLYWLLEWIKKRCTYYSVPQIGV